ncbi:phenylalanine--tRNA ligase subunit beta [Alkalilimnicola sp. S0819]|uniref:phenylalanine--tRNA ligase subunit beta n=1 Tax=Alkalilimnicola sp. S0819 TaxID=2613922 RepID=UPI001261E2DA|nr:phenylalanine--tRNA ligase subunit beta [Alkalilimnicola sp. S0819]KAB7623642.1 phenylalanine--tRNA ligase subunit beta [Alkalilimnicola sp. S0819]MPQ16766.1 phenylalanine--tRNA ligase subunit beta [Alkalilimnicola sp. S0819]
MRISDQWLREWVKYPGEARELADKLTMAGLEVDALEPAAPPFHGVVVAEIVECGPHPDADKLQVCRVSTGAEELQIVCGASNARVGLKVPLATVGGELPGGMKIRKAKLRGVESFGMLSSARELGLSEDHAGLMELPGDAPVGADLREYLGLDDQIVEVDLTPNRSDCLGMIGLAREVTALGGRRVAEAPAAEIEAVIEDRFPLRVDAPEACPRYLGRVVRGVDVTAPSPIWLQERLRRAGIRSLGPVVDITNYVMLELGQPMHAFDLARLQGGIVVRMAQPGDELELLNGETIKPDEQTLLIADDARPLALAGVMGGEGSGVTDDTRDIFFESAFFAPAAIAGRARAYGLHTDSSHRFERGVDPHIQRRAIERATALLLEIAGGKPGPVIEQAADEHLPRERRVRLRRARIAQLLGLNIPEQAVEAILGALGMSLNAVGEDWDVTVPPYRFDIGIEEDLIEELARVWGYERIPARSAAQSARMGERSEARLSLRRLRTALVDRGYQEAITYSFVDRELQQALDPEQEPLALANPISADLSVMRTSLWPGLVKAAVYNQARQQSRVRLFESGLRFRGALDELEQTPMLAGLVVGTALPEQWAGEPRPVDFFDAKADVEHLLALSGAADAYRFVAETHPALHPGQSARIYCDDQPVGWLGALHPQQARALDVDGACYLFELELAALQEARVPGFSELSKYPSIRRDLALLVSDRVSGGAITALVREVAGDVLRDLVLFDVYQGKGVPEAHKSVAIGLILQDYSRTLTDQDVDRLIGRVVERLGRDLGASLRE